MFMSSKDSGREVPIVVSHEWMFKRPFAANAAELESNCIAKWALLFCKNGNMSGGWAGGTSQLVTGQPISLLQLTFIVWFLECRCNMQPQFDVNSWKLRPGRRAPRYPPSSQQITKSKQKSVRILSFSAKMRQVRRHQTSWADCDRLIALAGVMGGRLGVVYRLQTSYQYFCEGPGSKAML